MRNEIKLRFEEPEYIIDRQNGVVVCKLTYRANYPEIVSYTMGLMMPLFRTVKAVAKVRYDDTFDFEIGKKVSLAKAEKKAYAQVFKACERQAKHLYKALVPLVEFANKADAIISHNNEYLSKF